MDRRKTPSEALDAHTSSKCWRQGNRSGVQNMQTVIICDQTKRCANCMTIARIYTENTPHGFYVRVLENQSSRHRRFRMSEQIIENCFNFITAIPVKAFVKVSIQKRLEVMEIRVECLALRDKSFDCVHVLASRHSLATRFLHIVFEPREEMISIWVHEPSDFKDVPRSGSLTPNSAGEIKDAATDINNLESPGSLTTASASTDSIARVSTAWSPATAGMVDLSVVPSHGSTPGVLGCSSRTSSPSRGEQGEPDEVQPVNQVEVSTVDSTTGYSADNSSSNTDSSESSSGRILDGKRHHQHSTADCPANSTLVRPVTKAEVKRAEGNDFAIPQTLQCRIETCNFPGVTYDKDEGENIPLLGSNSKSGVRRKRIARMIRKAEGYVQSCSRRGNSSTLRFYE